LFHKKCIWAYICFGYWGFTKNGPPTLIWIVWILILGSSSLKTYSEEKNLNSFLGFFVVFFIQFASSSSGFEIWDFKNNESLWNICEGWETFLLSHPNFIVLELKLLGEIYKKYLMFPRAWFLLTILLWISVYWLVLIIFIVFKNESLDFLNSCFGVLSRSMLFRLCFTVKKLFNVLSASLFLIGVFVSLREEKILSISAKGNVRRTCVICGNLICPRACISLTHLHFSMLISSYISISWKDWASLISVVIWMNKNSPAGSLKRLYASTKSRLEILWHLLCLASETIRMLWDQNASQLQV